MFTSRENAVYPLLHIDDNSNDRLLVREAIALTKTPLLYYEAANIDSAIPFFESESHEPQAQEFPRPALVLLDYDLGGQTGADFLSWLRLIKKAVGIPVAIFSGSPGQRNVTECYEQGANFFVNKATSLTRTQLVVRGLYLSLELKIPEPILRLDEYVPDPRTHGAQFALAC